LKLCTLPRFVTYTLFVSDIRWQIALINQAAAQKLKKIENGYSSYLFIVLFILGQDGARKNSNIYKEKYI
jgi:hypothetical protein